MGESIGVASMSESGEIRLVLRAEGGGPVGDALLVYPKGHPRYEDILRHVGGLKPGESKPVPPWSAEGGTRQAPVPRAAVWLAPPLMGAAGVFLVFSVLQLIRLVQKAHLLSVPLAAEQAVEFAAPGTVTLSVEGPRGTTRFSGLTFELSSAGSGARLEVEPVFFRLRTSGLSTARLEVGRCAIPKAGRYLLRVRGLEEGGESLSGHRVAFGRPSGPAMAAWIAGIILSFGALVGGLVLFVLALTGPTGAAP